MNVQPETTARGRGFGVGVAVGALGAFAFALIIAALPDALFTRGPWMAVMFAAQVPAGASFVYLARWVAKRSGTDAHMVLIGVVAGALLFDGVGITYMLELYGQAGAERANVAGILLWAFAWILIAAQVMNRPSIASRHDQR